MSNLLHLPIEMIDETNFNQHQQPSSPDHSNSHSIEPSPNDHITRHRLAEGHSSWNPRYIFDFEFKKAQ